MSRIDEDQAYRQEVLDAIADMELAVKFEVARCVDRLARCARFANFIDKPIEELAEHVKDYALEDFLSGVGIGTQCFTGETRDDVLEEQASDRRSTAPLDVRELDARSKP